MPRRTSPRTPRPADAARSAANRADKYAKDAQDAADKAEKAEKGKQIDTGTVPDGNGGSIGKMFYVVQRVDKVGDPEVVKKSAGCDDWWTTLYYKGDCTITAKIRYTELVDLYLCTAQDLDPQKYMCPSEATQYLGEMRTKEQSQEVTHTITSEEFNKNIDPVDILFGSWIKCVRELGRMRMGGSGRRFPVRGQAPRAARGSDPGRRRLDRHRHRPVLMADGSRKPIRDVRIGDLVLAADPATGRVRPRPVTDTYRHTTGHLVDITTDDGVLTSTTGHRVYVSGHGWTQVSELRPGDGLQGTSGQAGSVSVGTSSTRPSRFRRGGERPARGPAEDEWMARAPRGQGRPCAQEAE